MIQIGIIGLGFMASTHLKAYRHIPRARIAALCNPSGRHLDGDFSNVFGNIGSAEPLKLDMSPIKAFRNADELLADESIQLVDICSPTASHHDLCLKALKAGKHVLCEKPLARTAQEAREIAAAAATAKGFLMPAMCLRFWPEWAWLRKAIVEERFGRVLSARFQRIAEPPAWGHSHFLDGRQSGGALLDLHIHDTDFVQYCFGKPLSLFSTGYSKFSGAVDHVVTQYRVKGDAIVHAEGSWAMTPGFGFNMNYTANFEKATVDYNLARGAEALKLFVKGEEPQIIRLSEPDGYIGELNHLLDCIEKGQPPSVVTVADGVSAVEICEAEAESIRKGQVISIAP